MNLKWGFQVSPHRKILQLLNRFYKVVVRTGSSSNARKIAFMKTLLRVKALQEYDLIATTFGGTTATHPKYIRKELLKY